MNICLGPTNQRIRRFMARPLAEERSECADDDDREATEMSEYENVHRNGSLNAPHVCEAHNSPDSRHDRFSHPICTSLKTFWQRQVAATVSHHACRDHLGTYSFLPFRVSGCLMLVSYMHLMSHSHSHTLSTSGDSLLTLSLAALERTFLGYLRTSLALSMLAVIIAQLFRLQHTETPNKIFGFFVLGIPLACVCIGAAIIVLLLGAYRFWRQQNAILRGKVHAGGWEINIISIVVFLVWYSVRNNDLC